MYPGQAQARRQGPRLHSSQPDRRARRHPIHPWHGRQGPPSRPSRRLITARPNRTKPVRAKSYASRRRAQAASPALSEETMAIRNLSNLRAPKKANENKKRIGRGMGSGMAKTSTPDPK